MKAPKWLEDLPIAPPPQDRWQISLRPLSLSIEEEGKTPWQPNLLLIVESGRGAVLGHRLLEATPDPDLVIDLLFATMGEPALGEPRRPAKIQTDSDQILSPLKEIGQQLGLEVEKTPDLPELSYAIHTFEEFINERPALYMEAEDADEEVIGRFFSAAAAFYRAAPWKRVTDSEPLTLFHIEEGAKYAVVMGNAGIIRGLALYDDAEDLEDLYSDEDSLDPTELACTSVIFMEKKEVAPEQLEEIKQYGWETASYKAIPLATRTDALGPPRTPTMEQYRLLEQALYLLPRFIEGLPSRKSKREPQGLEEWAMTLEEKEVPVLIGYGIYELEQVEVDSIKEGEELSPEGGSDPA